MSDFTAVISNGLATLRSSSDAAGRSIQGLAGGMKSLGTTGEKTFRSIGQAITKMGGPLGAIGGQFFGAAGMEGGIRRLALAAVSAGIAFKAFGAVMQAATQRAKAFAEAAAGIRSAMRSAADASRSFAAGSENAGRSQARAENIFGADAGGRAGMLAQSYGVETADVLEAMGRMGGIRKEARGLALEAALTAAASGEMSASDAVGIMLNDPQVFASVMAQKAGGGLSAAQQGAARLIMAWRGARGPDALREAIDTVGATAPARAQLGETNRALNLVTRGQQAAFVSGRTGVAIREEAARVLNPAAAAILEWNKSQIEAIEKLRDASKKAGIVVEVINEVKGSLGFGERSFEGQARAAESAMGSAVTGTSGN